MKRVKHVFNISTLHLYLQSIQCRKIKHTTIRTVIWQFYIHFGSTNYTVNWTVTCLGLSGLSHIFFSMPCRKSNLVNWTILALSFVQVFWYQYDVRNKIAFYNLLKHWWITISLPYMLLFCTDSSKYIGCFSDPENNVLHELVYYFEELENTRCILYCKGKGYKYAGTMVREINTYNKGI